MKAVLRRLFLHFTLMLLALPCPAQQDDPASIKPESVIQTERILGFAISVSPDGLYFLTVGFPVGLWSLEGNLVRSLSFPEDRLPISIAFTPEGKIACAHSYGWDLLSLEGTPVERFNAPEPWLWARHQIMTDGRTVFTPISEMKSKLWNIGEKTAVDLPMPYGSGGWSPDGKFLAFSGGSENRITVYDTAGRQVGKTPTSGYAYSGAVSSQGALAWITLASKSGFYSLHFSSINGSASTVRDFPAEWSPDFYFLGFSPDGRMLAVAHRDEKTILLYDSMGKPLYRLEGLQAGVSSFAFTPDSGRLICASFDKSIRIWKLRSDRLLAPRILRVK